MKSQSKPAKPETGLLAAFYSSLSISALQTPSKKRKDTSTVFQNKEESTNDVAKEDALVLETE